MNQFKTLTFLMLIFLLASCSSDNTADKPDAKSTYPISGRETRELRNGKLTGEDGVQLMGKGGPKKLHNGDSLSRGVNAYLWQASLDVISFMPIATVDATGGVIITDWYADPQAKGERMKANIVVSSDELRASGVKVSLFREVNGKTASVNPDLARKLEDKILTRARELKIEDDRF